MSPFILLLIASFSFYIRVPLFKITNPYGDPLILDGLSMYKVFGRAEMMESEIMDHIISYWKDDPNMKYMFESGKRVLLSPFTIPVCFFQLTQIIIFGP